MFVIMIVIAKSGAPGSLQSLPIRMGLVPMFRLVPVQRGYYRCFHLDTVV
jgi:hypothetical protein